MLRSLVLGGRWSITPSTHFILERNSQLMAFSIGASGDYEAVSTSRRVYPCLLQRGSAQ